MCGDASSDPTQHDAPRVTPQPPTIHETYSGTKPEPGLDVERLTEALHSLHMPSPWRWWDDVAGSHARGTSVEFARAIARKYEASR